MVRIAVIGAGGRMGKQLLKATTEDNHAQLVVATCRPGASINGLDAGTVIGSQKVGTVVTDSISHENTTIDVVIDFTTPLTTMDLLDFCKKNNAKLVIGTTGFTEEQLVKIKEASVSVPIVCSPNMSLGVNLMFELLKTAAKAIGVDSDIEIIERHHRNKLDSPSGTAIKMGEVIADSLGRSLKEHAVYCRQGRESQARDKKSIGFSTIRAGEIIGDHTALFASDCEILEVTHKSSSRMNYAKGAVQAALWLNNQSAGFYDMTDVLGIQ